MQDMHRFFSVESSCEPDTSAEEADKLDTSTESREEADKLDTSTESREEGDTLDTSTESREEADKSSKLENSKDKEVNPGTSTGHEYYSVDAQPKKTREPRNW